MRLAVSIICSVGIIVGGWWLWNNNLHVRQLVEQYVENGEFLTLEARYTPDQVIEMHQSELLADGTKTLHVPDLKFHPYVLMEVKYTLADKKTREGVVLWSLVDGEMVIDTQTWEQTHGFEDTINANATASDFKILNALAKNKGRLTQEQLQKELHVELDTLGPWLDSVKQKHLVVQKGTEIQLHFQNPKFLVTPQTKINQWLVTKPYNYAQKVSKHYSASQIERNAKAAFGSDFTVRNIKEIYLPVYSIEIENPDGSILTTQWNALSGERIVPKYLSNF